MLVFLDCQKKVPGLPVIRSRGKISKNPRSMVSLNRNAHAPSALVSLHRREGDAAVGLRAFEVARRQRSGKHHRTAFPLMRACLRRM